MRIQVHECAQAAMVIHAGHLRIEDRPTWHSSGRTVTIIFVLSSFSFLLLLVLILLLICLCFSMAVRRMVSDLDYSSSSGRARLAAPFTDSRIKCTTTSAQEHDTRILSFDRNSIVCATTGSHQNEGLHMAALKSAAPSSVEPFAI